MKGQPKYPRPKIRLSLKGTLLRHPHVYSVYKFGNTTLLLHSDSPSSLSRSSRPYSRWKTSQKRKIYISFEFNWKDELKPPLDEYLFSLVKSRPEYLEGQVMLKLYENRKKILWVLFHGEKIVREWADSENLRGIKK